MAGANYLKMPRKSHVEAPLELKGREQATGVHVVFTPQTTMVTGGVRDDHVQAVEDYTVIVFAQDITFWPSMAGVASRSSTRAPRRRTRRAGGRQ